MEKGISLCPFFCFSLFTFFFFSLHPSFCSWRIKSWGADLRVSARFVWPENSPDWETVSSIDSDRSGLEESFESASWLEGWNSHIYQSRDGRRGQAPGGAVVRTRPNSRGDLLTGGRITGDTHQHGSRNQKYFHVPVLNGSAPRVSPRI